MTGLRIREIVKRMEDRAVEMVWQGTDWLTAAQLAARDPRVTPEVLQQWVTEGRLLSLQWNGEQVFPAYAFATDHSLLPAVGAVIAELAPCLGDWGTAAFFESTSRYLGGRRPRELVADEPELAIRAARFEREWREWAA